MLIAILPYTVQRTAVHSHMSFCARYVDCSIHLFHCLQHLFERRFIIFRRIHMGKLVFKCLSTAIHSSIIYFYAVHLFYILIIFIVIVIYSLPFFVHKAWMLLFFVPYFSVLHKSNTRQIICIWYVDNMIHTIFTIRMLPRAVEEEACIRPKTMTICYYRCSIFFTFSIRLDLAHFISNLMALPKLFVYVQVFEATSLGNNVFRVVNRILIINKFM